MRNIEPHEAAEFGARMEILARTGSIPAMLRAVEEFRDALSADESPFDGFGRVTELPLSLTDLDEHTIATLNTHEIVTIGDIRQAKERDLKSIRGVSPRKLAAIQAAIERLTDRYVDWVIKTGRG